MTIETLSKDYVYSDIRDFTSVTELLSIPPAILRKIASFETGKEWPDEKSIENFFADKAKNGIFVLASIPLNGLLSALLTKFFRDEPFPDRDDPVSPAWEKNVRDYLVDGNDDVIYFVHGYDYGWIDRDLLGGSGSFARKNEFESGFTILEHF